MHCKVQTLPARLWERAIGKRHITLQACIHGHIYACIAKKFLKFKQIMYFALICFVVTIICLRGFLTRYIHLITFPVNDCMTWDSHYSNPVISFHFLVVANSDKPFFLFNASQLNRWEWDGLMTFIGNWILYFLIYCKYCTNLFFCIC